MANVQKNGGKYLEQIDEVDEENQRDTTQKEDLKRKMSAVT